MIRSAFPADADAIARVHVQSWEETYRGVVPDCALDRMTYEIRTSQWRRGLANPARVTIVSEHEGIVDGFACAYENNEEPGFRSLLSTLYVLQRAQGRGVARELLRLLARSLIEREISTMWWLTLRDRNPARGFYERLGAELLREQPAPPELGPGVMDVVYGLRDLRVLC